MRATTNKIIEMIDEQILDPRDVVIMCLKYMSEDDVEDMAKANELFYEEDEEEVDEDTEEDYYDEFYHDASEEELRKMGCFDNLNDAEDEEADNFSNAKIKSLDLLAFKEDYEEYESPYDYRAYSRSWINPIRD